MHARESSILSEYIAEDESEGEGEYHDRVSMCVRETERDWSSAPFPKLTT